ncbi:hypothetical protein [Motilibacter aurantiacus]|uniref:hypothetical protein n=1 Tax=Motilibacter aurantiacus TaxID=2714955 RepID=UPI0014094994|nr:hypothetical protein [Motilibacter aurantiacus]NHC46056.1 hypothetical protein [Motilibacter aurantiacus]
MLEALAAAEHVLLRHDADVPSPAQQRTSAGVAGPISSRGVVGLPVVLQRLPPRLPPHVTPEDATRDAYLDLQVGRGKAGVVQPEPAPRLAPGLAARVCERDHFASLCDERMLGPPQLLVAGLAEIEYAPVRQPVERAERVRPRKPTGQVCPCATR